MAGSARARRKRAASGKGKSKARPSLLSDGHKEDDAQQLAEEITALSAIFQDDFKIVSERPCTEFTITVRPYPEDDGVVESDLSVELVVRCLPGYPHKPPKLQIRSEKQTLDNHWESLHSMLVDQAASIARQGRVMVFNLVEAAQEFLSEHREEKTSFEKNNQDAISASAPLQYVPRSEDNVSLDLFGDGWGDTGDHWDGRYTNGATVQVIEASPTARDSQNTEVDAKPYFPWKYGDRGLEDRPLLLAEKISPTGAGDSRYAQGQELGGGIFVDDNRKGMAEALQAVDEDSQELIDTPASQKPSHASSVSELLHKVYSGFFRMGRSSKKSVLADWSALGDAGSGMDDDQDLTVTDPSIALSVPANDSALHFLQKDLILGHLLRLVCGPKGPLPHTLSILASQLQKLGVIPTWLKDLLTLKAHLFDMTFRKIFTHDAEENSQIPDPSTRISVTKFWSGSPELLGEGNSTRSASRYVSDFEERSLLGRGGFGHVVLCVNKLDGRLYAMKKILLKDKSRLVNDKILREVATLSRLQHQHVVRYYQAWIETGLRQALETNSGSDEFESSGSVSVTFREFQERNESKSSQADPEVTTLYIQMEYCPRTLRQVLEMSMKNFDKEDIWRMFRQIVKGLVHIHGQGIIHRDLNPNNIFFDGHNDIKIGDFGLAKFSSLEQPDRDPSTGLPVAMISGSIDGTGQVGTYFYTAPEIEQGWPRIDEKVDMYSLGVVLFEMWYPFGTSMERYIVLNELKQKGVLPPMSPEFVQQCSLVKWLMAPDPSQRPSALQVLRSEFLPPRMEDESLNDILRTIQSGENSTVYDQVVAAIFDDERVAAEAERLNSEPLKHKRRSPDGSSICAVSAQDRILESVRDVFVRHGAEHLESKYMNTVGDGLDMHNRKAVKLVESSGTMLHLRYESRTCFARWVAANQETSLRRYEIALVFRRGVGHSAPQEYYQGDFDIIGGARALAEAEVVKVTAEVVSKCPSLETCEVHINHRGLLTAIWNWAGVKGEEQRVVAQILAVTVGEAPRSSARKSLWTYVRRQLQALNLESVTIDRLQTVERRLIGNANEALARLRGALPPSPTTLAAMGELTTLLTYLKVWGIDGNVVLDALMAPSEDFFDGIFFQVHVRKAVQPGSIARGVVSSICIAFGGRYDRLLQRHWETDSAPNVPGAVGVSIGVQKLIWASAGESKTESTSDVLVCSRGGGGLLIERMELVAELWAGGIKAEYVLSVAPSLTEQYEYAHEHGIRTLVIVTETGLSLAATVKVRHLDGTKGEVDVPREELVKHVLDNVINKVKRTGSSRHGNPQ